MNFHNPNPIPLTTVTKPMSAAEAAATLGRKAKGVPKTVTEADREGRRKRMEALNAKRKKQ